MSKIGRSNIYLTTTIIITITIAILLIHLFLIGSVKASLNLTIKTDKQSYLGEEIVQISGNLTINGSPVTDSLIAIQVNYPSGKLFLIRTLQIGSGGGNHELEILEVFSCNRYGEPKDSFKPGETAYLKIVWRNNSNSSKTFVLTYYIQYEDGTPMLACPSFSGTVDPNATNINMIGVPISSDAPEGNVVAYINLYSKLPETYGKPYCPEKNATFTISSTSSSSTEEISNQLQSSTDSFTLTFKAPRKPVGGNYTVYATAFYEGELAFATLEFELKLLGDLNGDNVIDMKDIGIVCKAYMSRPGDSNWNPEADFNGDQIVDMKDVGTVCSRYMDP